MDNIIEDFVEDELLDNRRFDNGYDGYDRRDRFDNFDNGYDRRRDDFYVGQQDRIVRDEERINELEDELEYERRRRHRRF
ncbi:hypothetical protein ES708_23836 [subsurface metagenome]